MADHLAPKSSAGGDGLPERSAWPEIDGRSLCRSAYGCGRALFACGVVRFARTQTLQGKRLRQPRETCQKAERRCQVIRPPVARISRDFSRALHQDAAGPAM